jgi:hypothetical protein
MRIAGALGVLVRLSERQHHSFRTADEAKAAADAHKRDELGERSKDGFEWFSMA